MTDLQPKIITDGGQHYDMVEWAGRNTSGIKPFGDRVLVLPDQPATKYGSILLPAVEIERAALAAETGVLVASGDGAWYWNSDRTRKYEGTKPVAGDRVYFERYAGAQYRGKDGVVYRLMDDKSVGGFQVEPEGEPVVEAGPDSHVVEAQALQDAITGTARADLSEAALGEALAQISAARAEREAVIEPKFPRYTVRDGQMLIAFTRQDMTDKAPQFIWFDTEAEARSAGGN
jgi:co-chaperonin GroES (HSP10)